MPRYFFHSRDGGTVQDEDGLELPGPAEARVEAVRYAGSVMSDEPDVLWDGRDFRVQVTDEDGGHVLTVVTLAVGHEIVD